MFAPFVDHRPLRCWRVYLRYKVGAMAVWVWIASTYSRDFAWDILQAFDNSHAKLNTLKVPSHVYREIREYQRHDKPGSDYYRVSSDES